MPDTPMTPVQDVAQDAETPPVTPFPTPPPVTVAPTAPPVDVPVTDAPVTDAPEVETPATEAPQMSFDEAFTSLVTEFSAGRQARVAAMDNAASASQHAQAAQAAATQAAQASTDAGNVVAAAIAAQKDTARRLVAVLNGFVNS